MLQQSGLRVATRCPCWRANTSILTSIWTVRSFASVADADLADSVASDANRRRLADGVNALSLLRSGRRHRRTILGSWTRRHLAPSDAPAGLFGIAELRSGPAGFRHLQEAAADTVAQLLREALDDCDDDDNADGQQRRRSRPLVRVLDDMSDAVCRVADMADCVRQLHPDAEYRHAAEEACVAIATLVESLNTNRPLYERLRRSVRDTGPTGDAARFGTDEIDARVGELLLWDFHQSGVHLASPAEGRQFVTLCRRAFLLGAEFARGAQQPARLRGRPLLDAAGDHPDAEIRRATYAAFHAENPQQESILNQLLSTRHDIARLAGFESFADRANAGCLLDSADSIEGFLGSLANQLEPHVARDAVAMRRLNDGRAPGAWDFVRLVNSATAACFNGDPLSNRVDEFFSIGHCLLGVAHVAERLFNVQLSLPDADATADGDVWDERVFRLSVRRRRGRHRQDEEELGRIYCDFFPRAGKPAQDCHFTIRGGRQGPPRQLPIVCLQLQCPDPPLAASGGGPPPSLLSPCQVENLFHEFGHALHSVLGCTRYQHVTGTRCATELAEVPSTLMEMFAFEPCVLRQYARHWRTGEPLPERLHAPLLASRRRVLPAASRQQQVLYAALDLRLHSAAPAASATTADVFRELAAAPAMRHLPAYPAGTAWHHRFTHLVGYGAKYHAYLVSRALATLIWSARFAADPLSSAAGADLERRLLSRGGEASTVAMVTELTGRPVTGQSLAESLVAEVAQEAC